MKKHILAFVFFLLLAIISVFYNYYDILFERPQSVHAWRQADCASIALNYYQDKKDFFHPETIHLVAENGTSGKCITSEIPLIYYFVSKLYSWFGYHEFLFRLVVLFMFFFGLFYLYRLLFFLLKSYFWAISVSLLFFTSPVLVYYANNFLSNIPALAFSFIGWYYFIRFYFEKKQFHFYLSIFVFFLAASFKLTAGLSLFVILTIYFGEALYSGFFKKGKTILHLSGLNLVSVFLAISLVISWIIYAHITNQKNDCTYFSTTTFPVWSLDWPAIKNVIKHVREIWLFQYFHKSVLFFLVLAFITTLVFIRKANRLLMYAVIVTLAGTVLFILFQFWTLQEHDYYIIELYILPVIIVVTFFDLLNKIYPEILNSFIIKILFLALLVFNINYAKTQLSIRYASWNDFSMHSIHNLTDFLRETGVSEKDTVISIPDSGPLSLYLMNQKGWTEYLETNFNRGERYFFNRDSAGIQWSIQKGARYLIINDIQNVYLKPYLQDFCVHLKGRHENVFVFDLKSKDRNFDLKNRGIISKFTCNAEKLDLDGKYYLGNDSNKFDNGSTQNSTEAFSGRYSSMVSTETPYGMTMKIKGVKAGESFMIDVWRKSLNKNEGRIIASSSDNYYNDYNIIEKKNSWEKIRNEFFIKKDLQEDLVIYVYNEGNDPVYFDDFEITRFKSIY